MQELLTYLLKSSGLTLMFFLAYHFLLRKETFFTSNRWFLLSGLVTSVILPLFFIKKIVFVEAQKIISKVVSNTNSQIILNENTIENSIINWFEISLYIYIVIAIILFIKIVYNLYSLVKVFENKEIIKDKNFKVIDTKQNIAPFSFFNYIVLNSNLYTQSELESILLHEKIHSAQKHSIDVLLINLFTVIFWFNPVLYWYKKAVIQNLEYIADSEAIAQIEDKKSYQMVLLKVVSNQNCLSITNHFYQSLIKKRIVMLNKNQSQKRNSWKYAVILPALIGFVLLFQIKVIAQEKEVKNNLPKVDRTSAVVVLNSESFIISKNTTEIELKKDAELLKKQYNIDCVYNTVIRNETNEIIGIKATYKNNEGKTWTKNIESSDPIEPIVFEVNSNQILFDNIFNSEYNYNEKLSKKMETDVWVKWDDAVAYKNTSLTPPVPPTAPIAPNIPEIKINSIPVPSFPNAPKAPNGSPITNEKEWKKFEKKMEKFQKKMEAMRPEMDAYAIEMSTIEEQMKPFEAEMKKFEEKMKVFEVQMKEYHTKLDIYIKRTEKKQ